MGGEWIERTIGEIADIVGGSTPSTKDPSNFDGDVPWLTPKDLSGPHPRYVSHGSRNLSKKGLESCSARLLPKNSVLLSSRAPIGYVAIAANPIATNQGFRSLLLHEEYDHEFVYYWLTHSTEVLERHASGSTFKELSGTALKNIRIRLPRDKGEQRAIAHILGTLDDKIELNRRMSETLEAMARALFKSWFVDFDPVRAKAEGRVPGLPKPLADLFPDSFQDSELGEIPKGWQVKPLGELFEVGLGGTWGKDAETGKYDTPIRCLRGIDCHHLAEGQVPDVPTRWVTKKQWEARRLHDGVILVEGSGSFCGRSLLWSNGYNILFGKMVAYSNFCKRLDPRCSLSEAVIGWQFMRKAFQDGEIQSFRTGTAFPNLDVQSVLANLLVCIPPKPIADQFAKLFWECRRIDLVRQTQTIAALRDALLPKLISGELRIEDAERFLHERGLDA